LRELFMLLVLGIPNDDIVLHVLSFLWLLTMRTGSVGL
jgi:hypothetical protein